MYLSYHFEQSHEMDDDHCPNFSNNNNTIEMNKQSYIKLLSAMFEELGVPTNKYDHLGHTTAPVKLEYSEFTAEEIKILGEKLF